MEHFSHPITDPRSRVSRNIIFRAGRLARSGAVPGMTAKDVAQDLRLHLLRRDGAFDPARGTYETFADRVIANRIATLASPTERLRAERGWIGFDEPAEGAEAEESLPLSETLGETAALNAPAPRAADEALGLVWDVRCLMEGLSPACRALASLLPEMSVADAARILGLHRSTVYDRIAAIRAAAVAMGLDDYLGARPTLAPPRR